ncbi:MAG: arsenic resistance protein [Spirochaetaceae bacterium]|nr:MAG: arsenic resistance protein [Spirochaetaceae bacterium]
MERELHVPALEKYLAIIIFPFMGIGLLTGTYFPRFAATLPAILPACLFLMIYPTMLNVRLDELVSAFRDWKKVGAVTLMNFVVSPVLLSLLAWVVLRNHPELMMGMIILSIAPCIALVLVWTFLSSANLALAVTLAGVNSLVQLVAFPIYLPLLGRIYGLDLALASGGVLAFGPIAQEVLIYLALPFLLAIVTRSYFERKKGRDWFESVYVPRAGHIAPIGVLITVTTMFSIGGQHVLETPYLLLLAALPLVVFFPLNWVVGLYLSHRVMKNDYRDSIAIAFSFSGRNLEVSMALSAALFGAGSLTAMATVAGPVIGIPAWIIILNLGKKFIYPHLARTQASQHQPAEQLQAAVLKADVEPGDVV